MTKLPSASVVVVRETPVRSFFAVTAAPATTAPEGSVMVPRIEPLNDWATDPPAKRVLSKSASAPRAAQMRVVMISCLLGGVGKCLERPENTPTRGRREDGQYGPLHLGVPFAYTRASMVEADSTPPPRRAARIVQPILAFLAVAAVNTAEQLKSAGIVDPVKVVRTALESVEGVARVDGQPASVQRDALPVTDKPDRRNPQALRRLDPASGLAIEVSPGTHWRLYAVYTDSLNPEVAPVGDGRLLGVPGNGSIPDLVPAVATNGETGWVSYHQLTDQANPQLTADGTSQAPIPVYGPDGTTVIGRADVSRPYR